MKIRLTAVLACGLIGAAAAARYEPGLPVWEEGERAGLENEGWVAGALLLTDDPVPEEIPQEAETPLNVDEPTAEEISAPETPANEIPQEVWPQYFDSRPASFLLDPQGLLGPVDYRDRLGFLNYHSSDSTIDLFVYLFKGDQEIPGEVRDEELIERFFSVGRPAAVVFYFMGAPQRSVLYLSPSLTDAVSAAEQRRAMESSVIQAFKDVDPSKQIEAFLVQMSIRIYWMERMLGGDMETGGAVPAFDRPLEIKEPKPSIKVRFQPQIDRFRRFEMPAAVAGGSLLVTLLAGSWARRRARYRFPEFDVEPRLGGSHAAGVGAVISFASAALPPASQRDQVPDYLRRA